MGVHLVCARIAASLLTRGCACMLHVDRSVLVSMGGGRLTVSCRDSNRFPMPLDATNQDDVFVGRIRRDISLPGNKNMCLFVCGDQIKKGAALNAVQIAENLV